MQTSLREASDPEFDADTIEASWGDGEVKARVYVFDGYDGVPVVQIDTDEPGRIRVSLNDWTVYDGDPEEVEK